MLRYIIKSIKIITFLNSDRDRNNESKLENLIGRKKEIFLVFYVRRVVYLVEIYFMSRHVELK